MINLKGFTFLNFQIESKNEEIYSFSGSKKIIQYIGKLAAEIKKKCYREEIFYK